MFNKSRLNYLKSTGEYDKMLLERQSKAMLFAGLVAAKEWGIDPLAVDVMFVPLEAGREIVVEGKEPIKESYVSVEYPEEVITLRGWQRDKIEVWLGYSKLCNVLVVRLPETEL